MHVATVVVTFNRLELLQECLRALGGQSRPPDSIFIIDNASTDGTGEWLKDSLPSIFHDVVVISLEENTGGAGGFATGMNAALESGADWVWMMDDDAVPHVHALQELMQVGTNTGYVYGSLAVHGHETAWAVSPVGWDGPPIDLVADIPEYASVESLPFLGIMIHRELVSRIGLPDPEYFIAADDVEYCLRARSAGADIILASASRIEHPKSQRRRFMGLVYIQLAPWKRYYDTRNRLLNARRYYGLRLYYQTIPGSLVRLIAILRYESDRLAQSRAVFAGMLDGLLGRKGRRHEVWGIRA